MLKLLVTGALVYFAYRFFFPSTALQEREPDASANSNAWERGSGDDDEYVDYEEVDE